MKPFYVLWLFLIIVFDAAGQDLSFGLEHFTSRDGLSNGHITDMVQDRRGFLWLATQDGLNKFDGVSFKAYTPYQKRENPPKDIRSQKFAIDHTGTLWILDRYGLCFYDESYDCFRYFPLQGISFPIHENHDLVFDAPHQCLWLITSSGTYSYDITRKKVFPTSITSMYRPFEGLITKQGQLVIAASEGAYVVDLASRKHRYYPIDDDDNERAMNVHQDSEGQIWMGRWGKGLMSFDPSDGKTTTYLPTVVPANNKQVVVMDIAVMPALTGYRTLWVATLHHGIFLFDLKTKQFSQSIKYDFYSPDGLLTNGVRNLYLAPDGLFWISDGALSKLDISDQQFHIKTTSLPDGEPRMVLPDKFNKKRVWIAYLNDGLVYYDLSNNKPIKWYRNIDGSNEQEFHQTIYDICYDESGNLWVSGRSGLCIIDRTFGAKMIRFKPASFNHGVYSIAHDKEDVTWCVFGLNILLRYERGLGKAEFFNLPLYGSEQDAPYINHLLVDGRYVWLGTYNGLYQFDKLSKKFIGRYLNASLDGKDGENTINHMSRDKGGRIWAAFAAEGIKCFVPSDGRFISYPTTRAFAPVFVKSDNSNKIWFQTNKGFYRFDEHSGKVEDFTNYARGNLDEYASSPAHADNHWHMLVRSRFLIDFEPNKMPVSLPTARPWITSFKIFDKPVHFSPDSAELVRYNISYWQNVISFDFTSPLYTRSDQLRFDYLLEGFDHDWITAGKERSVTYTNLNGGDYTFKVRAFNSLGQQHPKLAIFHLHVQTPYWRTWWFSTLTALILIGIVSGIFRYREKQRRKLASIRDDIARDLHDEVGSSLSSIRILSQNIERINNVDPVRARLALQQISNTAGDMMEAMSDIVWSINPENDSMGHLIDRMWGRATELLGAADIQIEFSISSEFDNLVLPADIRRDLLLIFKEALNNIAKHSGASHVIVTLSRSEGMLFMSIKDDGNGFNVGQPTAGCEGNGIKNMHRRAKKMGGKANVLSAKGRGTKVVLQAKLV